MLVMQQVTTSEDYKRAKDLRVRTRTCKRTAFIRGKRETVKITTQVSASSSLLSRAVTTHESVGFLASSADRRKTLPLRLDDANRGELFG
jgi:hypothetical protein